MKRESNFTLLFRHWLKAHPMDSSAFELKQTLKNSIAFSAIKYHQLNALLAANSSHGLLYKAPDDSRGIKPCDLLYLRGANGYIVIKYPSCFVIIPVQKFMQEQETNTKKSLTEERAREIASIIVDL